MSIFTGGAFSGIQGGGGGGTTIYEHTQATLSDTWTINHGLGYEPEVEVLLDGDTVPTEPGVEHVSSNQTILTFDSAVKGRAVLR